MSPFEYPDGTRDVVFAVTFAVSLIWIATHGLPWLKTSPFPLINDKKRGEFTYARARKEFMFGARQLIEKGLKLAPGQPFRIMGDVGEIFILPSKYAHEIRNHGGVSFGKAAARVRKSKGPSSSNTC